MRILMVKASKIAVLSKRVTLKICGILQRVFVIRLAAKTSEPRSDSDRAAAMTFALGFGG